MVRPLTCVCFLLALCSGAYVYITKHDALLLDRRIEKKLKDTEALREQTRMLHAEWTLLNDPERLRLFADRYLSLKPVAPQQFTSLNDLAFRLPAIKTPTPEPIAAPAIAQHLMGEPAQTALAAIDPVPELIDEELPIPPLFAPPPPQFVAAPLAPVAERKPPIQRPPLQVVDSAPAPRQVAQADSRPPAPRVVEPRIVEPRIIEQRQAAIQPVPGRSIVSAQAIPVFAHVQAPMPSGGSLLGMAQGSLPAPLPRPTPFSNLQYNVGN